MKILPAALRVIAGITSGTSAVAAYPVANEMFGNITGGVLVASCAAVIFAGWHYVGTESEPANSPQFNRSIGYRLIAGTCATSFAIAMVAGIHISAERPMIASAAATANQAEALYNEQERSRMSNLSKLTDELRVTSKKKNPAEYTALQAQIDKLSTPGQKPILSEQNNNRIPKEYSLAVAGVFEVVTPALLILAGLFGRRQVRQTSQLPATTTAINTVDQAFDTVVTPVDNNAQVIENIELTQYTAPSTATTDPVTKRITADDIQEAIASKLVAANKDGNVTAAAVQQHTGCSARQARDAMPQAANNGYLSKSGVGNSTRYSYPKMANLRSVK